MAEESDTGWQVADAPKSSSVGSKVAHVGREYKQVGRWARFDGAGISRCCPKFPSWRRSGAPPEAAPSKCCCSVAQAPRGTTAWKRPPPKPCRSQARALAAERQWLQRPHSLPTAHRRHPHPCPHLQAEKGPALWVCGVSTPAFRRAHSKHIGLCRRVATASSGRGVARRGSGGSGCRSPPRYRCAPCCSVCCAGGGLARLITGAPDGCGPTRDIGPVLRDLRRGAARLAVGVDSEWGTERKHGPLPAVRGVSGRCWRPLAWMAAEVCAKPETPLTQDLARDQYLSECGYCTCDS